MIRIEINVMTGEKIEIELTPEEVTAANLQYQNWLVEEQVRKAKEDLVK